jgi:hypothetical protein
MLHCPTSQHGLKDIKARLSNILLRTGGHPRVLSEIIGKIHPQEGDFVKEPIAEESEGSIQATADDPDPSLLMWLKKSLKSFKAS